MSLTRFESRVIVPSMLILLVGLVTACDAFDGDDDDNDDTRIEIEVTEFITDVAVENATLTDLRLESGGPPADRGGPSVFGLTGPTVVDRGETERFSFGTTSDFVRFAVWVEGADSWWEVDLQSGVGGIVVLLDISPTAPSDTMTIHFAASDGQDYGDDGRLVVDVAG